MGRCVFCKIVAGELPASVVYEDARHLAINDGPASNQSVPHVHLHVLPRTRGDLPRLLLSLATRPLIALRLLRPAPRATLDRQAAELRSALVFPS